MLPDLKLVIRLQEIDNRLGDLTREIAALPIHIAEIEKKLTSHERKLEADRAALAANQKERKKCELDIQTQDQKISKLKDQMLSAKTNEQYRAFQNEIEFCQKEIRKAEDRILELMSESEPLDKNVKAAEEALKAEKAQVESEKQEARERTAADQKAAAQLQAERAATVKDITPGVYQQYERVRKARRGIAVAEAVDGRCTACNMAMRLQFFQDLKKGDRVMACESCNRILYYNPPVSLEDAAGETAAVRK
ncbi:MAG TPA: C4-type zinc ribbon domain-containing protein [Bryobacteraceae bacterium]|jgi:predicted  nucleic acid-binding Zn-ribbon protein|nr:C4-type zinc ribbon domain-containing protein [Bryobacteraceae bacterium]